MMKINSSEKTRYKNAVDSIPKDEMLEKRIESHIRRYSEERPSEKILQFKKINLLKAAAAFIISCLFIVGSLYIALSFSYPISPVGVVRHYVSAVESDDFDKAEWYLNAEEVNFADSEAVLSAYSYGILYRKLTFEVKGYTGDNTIKTVDVKSRIEHESFKDHRFWLRKTNGRWHIYKIETVDDKS